jgi:hypothetical protein
MYTEVKKEISGNNINTETKDKETKHNRGPGKLYDGERNYMESVNEWRRKQ